MKTILLSFIMLFSVALVQAQDQIHTTSGKIIECKVMEVGVDEIKYKISKDADAAMFAIKKIDVVKIVFADGTVEKFKEEINDPELYAGQKKNAIKMEFLSPLYGYSAFSFERSIKPGMSWEGTLGLIGLGKDIDLIRPRGANLKFGFRFLKTPDFKTGNLRYWHLLKGAYIQPQVIVGAYQHDVTYWNVIDPWTTQPITKREVTSYAALNLVFGKQAVYSDIFLFDIYAGLGYGKFSTTGDNNASRYGEFGDRGRHYGVAGGWEEIPVTFTAGIKLGILVK